MAKHGMCISGHDTRDDFRTDLVPCLLQFYNAVSIVPALMPLVSPAPVYNPHQVFGGPKPRRRVRVTYGEIR